MMNHASQPTINTLFVMKNILAIMAASLLFGVSHAATITVNDTADNTTTDGRCTFREAVITANINLQSAECPRTGDVSDYDDEIVFAVSDSQIDLSLGKIDISDDLAISGSETQRMILDGGKDTPTNGTHRNDDEGLFNVSANLTLNYLEIQNHINANDGGGAIHMTGDTLAISHTVFEDNTSGRNGGALYMEGSTGTQLSISDSYFGHNTANSRGAIDSNADAADIKRSHFVSNSVTVNVGAVFAKNLTVSDSLFESNTAGYNSGALYLSAAGSVNNTQFIANTAGQGSNGALHVYAVNDNIRIDNSTFANNSATGSGGALMTLRSSTGSGEVVIANSTFYNNYAGDEGGAIWGRGQLAIQSITAVNNQADTAGGFIYFDGGSANLTLNGSLLLDNGLGGSIQDCSGDRPNMLYSGYNVLSADTVGDNTCGLEPSLNPTTTLGWTAILSTLSDNGCVTPLGYPASQQCGLTMRPHPGSVAMDAGDVGGLSTDQRGLPRVLGTAADAGAVESGVLMLTVTPNGNGAVSAAMTPLPQSGAIDTCRLDNISTCQAQYLSGESITLTAMPDAGFAFKTWEGDCNTTTSHNVTMLMDRDKTCSVKFEALTYSLGGTITGLTAGESVTLSKGNGQTQTFTGGSFTFTNSLPHGSSYAVAVTTEPVGKTCTVTDGSGNITMNTDSVAVDCVSDVRPEAIFIDGFE